MNRLWKLIKTPPVLVISGLAVVLLSYVSVSVASDHDDGEYDGKGRNLNLTDLYVFLEGSQTGTPADNDNLILVMNTNPRSVPKQQYFFSSTARYEFHASQVAESNKAKRATGADDVTVRFTFSEPDTNNQQAMTVTTIKNGNASSATSTVGGGSILTTALPGTTEVNNSVSVGGTTMTVFAGLREDPFFFDVKRYFILRNCLVANASDSNPLAACSGSSFLAANSAEDFAHGYNVNAIVARIPKAFFQADTNTTHLDFWETISVPAAN